MIETVKTAPKKQHINFVQYMTVREKEHDIP